MSEYKLLPGFPYPLGALVNYDLSVNIAMVHNSCNEAGIVIYNYRNKTEETIILDDTYRTGNIYAVRIEGINITDCDYYLLDGDKRYCDPYGKLIRGNEKWGAIPGNLRSSFVISNITDKKPDKPIKRDFSDSIIYELHVRGFTKHSSSKVKYPGTFEGITEKVDYLTDLGITAVELLPAYEFIEMEPKTTENTKDSYLNPYEPIEPKLNYWGYKEAYYYAPKASYSAKGKNAGESFLNMVNELHNHDIEVIMQFYFPSTVKQSFIIDVLKYWIREYQVDGFHLIGDKIPLVLIGTEPMFTETKFIYNYFPVNEIYGSAKPAYKNLAVSNDDYMYTFRRFLKSDEGQINSVIDGMKYIDDTVASVHYMANSNSFTLMDLVSFDRKHNEDNGENNHDGNPYNASWNCGVEGTTNKKSVLKLRKIQIKNAICFNLLSQGTPLINAGDEFGNSQKGNNNPYCIDNQITWINWNDAKKHNDIYEFTKRMIELRKSHAILHMNRPFKMSDYAALGLPDLSIHGEEAWMAQTDMLTRHFGMLYSSDYAKAKINDGHINKDECTNEYLYIGINMHWTEHEFALPAIPNSTEWEVVVDTSGSIKNKIINNAKKISVKERSIIVLINR